MQGHGGNLSMLSRIAGRPAADILDFSANINPLGPPACVGAALLQGIEQLGHYPDPDSGELVAAIADHCGVEAARVVAGNGAEQLIWWLPRVLGARRVVVTGPAYLDYARAAAVWKLPVETLLLRADEEFALDAGRLDRIAAPGDLIWIGHPNNPTGRPASLDALRPLIERRPGVWWAIDEAFIDFVADGRSAARWDLPNLVVVRSMTKFYALAGLRLGYAILPDIAAAALRAHLPAWSVNTPAQLAGTAILRDPALAEFAASSRSLIAEQRETLARAFSGLGFKVYASAANYLLLRVPPGEEGRACSSAAAGELDAAAGEFDAAALARVLLEGEGIAVRVCDNYSGLDGRYLRVAVRGPADNRRLIAAVEARLEERALPGNL
jgi:L-threonine-O-3-phosphate decarboxylase